MRILLLIIVAFIFVSCSSKPKSYLTVEETVRQCKVCTDNGLFATTNYNYNGNYVISVTCETKRSTYITEYAKVKKDTLNDTIEKY